MDLIRLHKLKSIGIPILEPASSILEYIETNFLNLKIRNYSFGTEYYSDIDIYKFRYDSDFKYLSILRDDNMYRYIKKDA